MIFTEVTLHSEINFIPVYLYEVEKTDFDTTQFTLGQSNHYIMTIK